MINQMKQLTGGFQILLAARTAVLVWRDGSHETVERRLRIVLSPQPQPHSQRDDLRSEPEDPTMQGARPQHSVADRELPLGRDVTHRDAAGFHRSRVRLPIILQIGFGERQETCAGVAFIGEYESRGNR